MAKKKHNKTNDLIDSKTQKDKLRYCLLTSPTVE
ncbi:hypothetical protein CASFOL_019098 [Castilleja foliolosa]|uniref:Uncharacterized protein n=1 Tax=Castilleja foliolosa TaxID=1961234 RepID=A0ABD3D680_9LAMI